MPKQTCQFINATGTKLDLVCVLEDAKGCVTYCGVILPEGRTAKPKFVKGDTKIYITYQKDKWYLID